MNAAVAAGWTGDFGADADHLKTPADVDRTFAVGFCFFTIDPSDAVDAKADNYPADVLKGRFAEVRDEIDWFDKYLGKSVKLATGTTVELDEEAVMRAAVKYGRALNRGIELADYIRKVNEAGGRDYEIELSVDETDQPTTLAEHYIIADQCLGRGMKLVSLAPRFVGTLEKGVDYIGDVAAFEKSLARSPGDRGAVGTVQAEPAFRIGQALDLSVARAGDGRPVPREDGGHSYLGSAPRGGPARSARCSARSASFRAGGTTSTRRRIMSTRRSTWSPRRPTVTRRPPARAALSRVLGGRAGGRWLHGAGPADSALHFGSVLTDPTLGRAVRDCLDAHPDTYKEILAVHFEKHLRALQAGC